MENEVNKKDSFSYSLKIDAASSSSTISNRRVEKKSVLCNSVIQYVSKIFLSVKMFNNSLPSDTESIGEEITDHQIADRQPISIIDTGFLQCNGHYDQQEEEETAVVVDWSRLDPKILKLIFAKVTVCDVYFSRFVCCQWYSAAKDYFDSTTILNWRQLIHCQKIDHRVNYRARLCTTCFKAAIFRMPKLVSIDFRFGENVREIRYSNRGEFQDLVLRYLENIKEIRFSNNQIVHELFHFIRHYAPPMAELKIDYH